VTRDTKLLRAMIADPNATQADWARATGVAKSNVNRRLTRLQRGGLVRSSRGKWLVTKVGRVTVQNGRKTKMSRPVSPVDRSQ
jgi:DNA-binding IclR family transcriptional regulator